MEFTVTNTSREMSSFSDYPPPPDLPTYLPHKLMLQYLTDYADHFGVIQCIRFNHIVHKVNISLNSVPLPPQKDVVDDHGFTGLVDESS